MVLKISKEIQEKFKGKGNLFEMDKPLRDEYYREIETFQDTYFFYKNKELWEFQLYVLFSHTENLIIILLIFVHQVNWI